MALGPSTIVLGILTCIPFGLAVRDEITGKATPGGGEYGDLDFGREDRMARAERIRRIEAMAEEETRLREEENERAAARKAELDKIVVELFGETTATLSSRFTIKPGDPATAIPEQVMNGEADFEQANHLQIHGEVLGNTLHGITIEPVMDHADTRELCDRMDEWLGETWGDVTAFDNNQSVWLDEGGKRRAALLRIGGNCKVVVESTARVDEWITKEPSSIVPVWAVGRSPKQLAQALGVPSPTDNILEWSAPGLGAGFGKTSLTAYIVRGKVIGVEARVRSFARPTEIEDHLTELFGDASEDDPSVWQTKPPIAIDTTTTLISVLVGKQPPGE